MSYRSAAPPPTADKAKMDSEVHKCCLCCVVCVCVCVSHSPPLPQYLSLMKELGEKVPEHMQGKSGFAIGTRVPPPPGLVSHKFYCLSEKFVLR